jgi:hypothetical protein
LISQRYRTAFRSALEVAVPYLEVMLRSRPWGVAEPIRDDMSRVLFGQLRKMIFAEAR